MGIAARHNEAANPLGHIRQLNRCGAGFAEHHVGVTGLRPPIHSGQVFTHDHFTQTITVDVADKRHRHACVALGVRTVDDKPPGPHCADIDVIVGGAAEHHIGLAWSAENVSLGIALRSSNDQVCIAIPVDIAAPRHRSAEARKGRCGDFKATIVGAGPAVFHKHFASTCVVIGGTDHDVRKTIPVQIAGRGHRKPELLGA